MASILNVILRVTGQNNLGGALTGLNQGLQLAQAGAQALADTVGRLVASGIAMDSFLESSELQFKTLTGSAEAAHAQVAMLFDLAAHSPFTFESVTVASRQLEVFGGRALDTRDNLVMLGDAAAATSAPIEQITFWTGRLYSALQAGEPIGMATMWLQRMGVLSAEATQQMKALSDAGASADEVWKAFTDSQMRFSGAMKEQETTWKGLTSTMSDTLTLLTGTATHEGFVRLEGDIKRVNAALADPQAQEDAKTIGKGFAVGLDVAAATAEAGFARITEPVHDFNRIVADTGTLVKLTGEEWGTIWGNDLPAALEILKRSFVETADSMANMESAGRTIASVMESGLGVPEIAKAPPLIDQVRDSWEQAAHAADEAALSFRGVRDEMTRIGAQQPILNQERDAAHQAEMDQLREQGLALAHAGDINQIVAQEQVAAQQFATKQHEDLLKQVADAEERNRKQAEANWAAYVQDVTEKQRAAEQQIQDSIHRAYQEWPSEAEAAYQRVVQATQPLVDTLSQQLNEATNRQVREGIAGTADAEKQLDDIRRAHLATLPDLVALDQQYAAAQGQVHDADVALAAAQRNLAVALAASGGQQTEYTAQLSHAITAAQDADQAARAHAAALGQEQSQAVSDTNALRGLAAQRAGMGGGGGGGLLLMDTGSQANRTTIYGRPLVQPQIITNNITNNGPVGVDDLNKQIIDTVNNGRRSGAIQALGR